MSDNGNNETTTTWPAVTNRVQQDAWTRIWDMLLRPVSDEPKTSGEDDSALQQPDGDKEDTP